MDVFGTENNGSSACSSTSSTPVDEETTMEEKSRVDYSRLIEEASQDQLRVVNSLLIKTLLCLTVAPGVDPLAGGGEQALVSTARINIDQAFSLFCNLCVHGNLERECSWLLLRCCQSEPWWGRFISQCLRNYFVTQVLSTFFYLNSNALKKRESSLLIY